MSHLACVAQSRTRLCSHLDYSEAYVHARPNISGGNDPIGIWVCFESRVDHVCLLGRNCGLAGNLRVGIEGQESFQHLAGDVDTLAWSAHVRLRSMRNLSHILKDAQGVVQAVVFGDRLVLEHDWGNREPKLAQ